MQESSRGGEKTGMISKHTNLTLTIKVQCVFMVHPSWLFNRSRVNPSNNENIELQKCEAYEVVKLSRQRVTMNDNPAYGEIGAGVHWTLNSIATVLATA